MNELNALYYLYIYIYIKTENFQIETFMIDTLKIIEKDDQMYSS